jgi:AcrR family transcriptional regulator
MTHSASKLEASRQHGKNQVDAQRESILEAAEKCFLQNGLENTKMIDIAAAAGITKMSLYRYFPNRDVIALEIHARMTNHLAEAFGPEPAVYTPDYFKQTCQFLIRNFDALRDVYRYMGMFDKIYLDDAPEAALTHWTRGQLFSQSWNGIHVDQMLRDNPHGNRLLMVFSTVIWFLEKLALRGELTWSDQAIPLQEHLRLFEEMISGYIDQIFSQPTTGS